MHILQPYFIFIFYVFSELPLRYPFFYWHLLHRTQDRSMSLTRSHHRYLCTTLHIRLSHRRLRDGDPYDE
jgi:hypothetical protein